MWSRPQVFTKPPKSVSRVVYAIVLPWMAFTLVIYGMIVFGGFVKTWGLDHTLTLAHSFPSASL